MEFRIVLDKFPASLEEQQVRLGRGDLQPLCDHGSTVW